MLKKVLSLTVAALLSIGLLSACGGEDESSAVSLNVDEAAETLVSQLTFQDEMLKLEDSVLEKFYDVDPDAVGDIAVYTATSGVKAEEVAVVQVKDGGSDTVKAMLDSRLEDQIAKYEGYAPEEMPKLENPVMEEKNGYYFFILADDQDAAREAIDGLFA